MIKISKVFCLAQLADTNPNLFVCDDPQPRKCVGKCNKLFVPTIKDISTGRPSTYCKQCGICREYMQKRNKICAENKFKRVLTEEVLQENCLYTLSNTTF